MIEDPDDRDAQPMYTREYHDKVIDFISKHLKCVSTQSCIYEACLATVSSEDKNRSVPIGYI